MNPEFSSESFFETMDADITENRLTEFLHESHGQTNFLFAQPACYRISGSSRKRSSESRYQFQQGWKPFERFPHARSLRGAGVSGGWQT